MDYELKFKREKIEALIKKSEPERKAVEDGCLKVKECSEEFLKRVLPSGDGNTTPVIDGTIGRLEITVNDLVEQVTSQEAFVLKQIQLRKTVLSGCAEFVCFQETVQEVFCFIILVYNSLISKFLLFLNIKDVSRNRDVDFNNISVRAQWARPNVACHILRWSTGILLLNERPPYKWCIIWAKLITYYKRS